MATWIWNGLGCTHKDKQIAEMQSENVKLRSKFDEVLEREHELDVEVLQLQSALDDLFAENESLHNIGIEYQGSEEQLKKERDDLKNQLDARDIKIASMRSHIENLEHAITDLFLAISKEVIPS